VDHNCRFSVVSLALPTRIDCKNPNTIIVLIFQSNDAMYSDALPQGYKPFLIKRVRHPPTRKKILFTISYAVGVWSVLARLLQAHAEIDVAINKSAAFQ
jgi:hypothetical protein